jgi:hypothetical protein
VSLRLYLDHHIRAEITSGLRRRQIDVLTAYEDQRHESDDAAILDRAAELGRVLFSQDTDLLAHAAEWQRAGRNFPGLIFAHQLGITIGRSVEDLELICLTCDSDEIENRVIYLPL